MDYLSLQLLKYLNFQDNLTSHPRVVQQNDR